MPGITTPVIGQERHMTHPMERDPSSSLAARRDAARAANAVPTKDTIVPLGSEAYRLKERENADRIVEAKRSTARDMLYRRLGYMPSKSQVDDFLGIPSEGQ